MNEGTPVAKYTYSLQQMEQSAPLFDASAVAIGNFDGVHKGHRRVLQEAVRRGREDGKAAVALSFHPHPRAIVGDGAPPALATKAKQRSLVRALGVEALVVLRFDETVAALDPEQFVELVLVGALRAGHVIVGENFRFGHRARGTTDTLATLGHRHGYALEVVPPVRTGEEIVSSSVIRRLVQEGDVQGASRLLGRAYELTGTVVAGEGRGASLGFPTANVVPADGLLVPGFGVYAARAAGQPAVAVVGDKPTFGHGVTVLEVHVLDFDDDLRGRTVDVQFVRRLRGVVKFDTVAALQEQMAADVEAARAYLRKQRISEASR